LPICPAAALQFGAIAGAEGIAGGEEGAVAAVLGEKGEETKKAEEKRRETSC
jgi:hypothetical protein